MEDLLAQQTEVADADLNSLHSDSPIVNKNGVVVEPHAYADATPQERLARLNPNAKSSVLSRSALRALKREEQEVAASNFILFGSGVQAGLDNINSHYFNVQDGVGDDINFN